MFGRILSKLLYQRDILRLCPPSKMDAFNENSYIIDVW